MPSTYLRRIFPSLYPREQRAPLGLSVPAYYFIVGMFTGAAITILCWVLFAPRP